MYEGGSVYRPIDQGQDFLIVDINCKGEQIDRINRQEHIGRRISELSPDILSSKLIEIIQRVHTTGTSEQCPIVQYQNHYLEKYRDNYVFRLESGEIVVVYDDVTEKKLLEEELKQSRYKVTLQNNIITQFLTTDDDAAYQQVLQFIAEALQSSFGFLGYLDNSNQLIATNLNGEQQRWSKTDAKDLICDSATSDTLLSKALKCGTHLIQNNSLTFPVEHIALQNGLAVPVQYRKKTIGVIILGNKKEPYTTEDASLLEHICSYIAPILQARLQAQYNKKLHVEANTELKGSEANLKEAEKLAKIGHWEHNLINDTLFWSDEVYRIFGLDAEHFKPSVQKFIQQIHPDDRELVTQNYLKAVTERTTYEVTHRILLSDGTVKFVHERCITTYNKHNKPIRSLGTVQDITERVQTEEANKRLATAIDQTADVIVITDTNGIIQYVNPAFEKLTGYPKETAIGLNPSVLQSGKHQPSFYRELWNTISSGRVWHGNLINKKKNGELFTEEATITPVIDGSGEIINYVAVKHDISRELELEQQLRQAVKMEAMGTLAGGIAHDFNNILGAILGYTRMAMDDLSTESQPYQDLCKVTQSGERAADLVRQILLFSRHQEQGFIPVKIQFLINEAMKMLRASLPASITLKENIEQECPAIMADPTQIHQIIMNLCTNARQAMLAEGGTLTISLSQRDIRQEEKTAADTKPGQYVQLTIKDTGKGIAKNTLIRIFDPFFTTKEIGKGTGLGLAVVHGIVKSHHGSITVESELQQGTRFTILLPMATTEPKSESPKNDQTIPGGTEYILVVDDEPNILMLRKRLLLSQGYQVSTFSSSIEALASFKKDPFKYDLLLTDMTMPDMDGMQLTANIKELRPTIPAILCTGNSELIDKEKAAAYGFHDFLEKPIKPITLKKTLRRIFDDRE